MRKEEEERSKVKKWVGAWMVKKEEEEKRSNRSAMQWPMPGSEWRKGEGSEEATVAEWEIGHLHGYGVEAGLGDG